jgi:hypothetical protein
VNLLTLVKHPRRVPNTRRALVAIPSHGGKGAPSFSLGLTKAPPRPIHFTPPKAVIGAVYGLKAYLRRSGTFVDAAILVARVGEK